MPPDKHFYSHSSSDRRFKKVDNFSRMPTMNHLIKLALTKSLEHMDDTGYGENYSASYAPREYFIHGGLEL